MALCLIWFAFPVFPLYWTVVTALEPPTAVFEGPTYLPWLDFQPTLQGFREVLGGARGSMVPPLVNSSLVALTATFVATLLGAMAAYALVRFDFQVRLLAALLFALTASAATSDSRPSVWSPSRPWAWPSWRHSRSSSAPTACACRGGFGQCRHRVLVHLPAHLSAIVSAFALYLVYARLGNQGLQALDTFWGLTLCYVAFILPIVVWLMREFGEPSACAQRLTRLLPDEYASDKQRHQHARAGRRMQEQARTFIVTLSNPITKKAHAEYSEV